MSGWLINIVKKKNLFFIFLFFQLFSIFITFSFSVSHRSFATELFGDFVYNMQEVQYSMRSYFDLKAQNEILQQENNKLYTLLHNPEQETYTISSSDFSFIPTQVIKRTRKLSQNYILINTGRSNEVNTNMGIINHQGVVGIVQNVSRQFGLAVTLLHQQLTIPVYHHKSNQYGFLKWDGNKQGLLKLTDIPKYAQINLGDTIVTDGNSQIFPQGIPVGSVVSKQVEDYANHYTLMIKPFVDYNNIRHVYVIANKDTEEIKTLIQKDYE